MPGLKRSERAYLSRWVAVALGLTLSAAVVPVRAEDPVALWEALELRVNLSEQRLIQSLSPENQPQLKGNLLAWVDKDSLRFAMLERIYPTDLCAHALVQEFPLPALPLPQPNLSAPPALGLLMGSSRFPETPSIRASVAIALPGGMIHRYDLAMNRYSATAWTVVKRDSLKVALGAGQRPTLLVPFADAALGNDSSLILSGTGGLLRTLNRTHAGLSQSGILKTPEEEPVSFGGRLFGGAKGGIYRWGNVAAPLVLQGRPFQVPVRVIDSSGALGDEGWAAVRLATGWQGYPLAPGRFQGFKVVRDSGLGIVRYPDTGAAVPSRLRDTPSRIPALTPAPRYSASMGAVTVKVPLEDSESTYSPPGVALIGKDTLPMTPGFIRSGPPIGCAGLRGLCVQDDAAFIGLGLSADSVVLTMKVQASKFTFAGGCSDKGLSRDSLYRRAAPWREGQKLEIRLDGDLLTLAYEGAMGMAMTRRRSLLREGSAGYDALGRTFRARKWDGAGSPSRAIGSARVPNP